MLPVWRCKLNLARIRLLVCEPFPVVSEILDLVEDLFYSGQLSYQQIACRSLIELYTNKKLLAENWKLAIFYAHSYCIATPRSLNNKRDTAIRDFMLYARNPDSPFVTCPLWLSPVPLLDRY